MVLEGMRKPSIKTAPLQDLSFDELLSLRFEIDAVLARRIEDEKQALEAKLAKLGHLSDSTKPAPLIAATIGRVQTGPAKGTKVPPRFYNPDNPSETWSGRGLRPRWMVAALAAGRSIEEMILDDELQPVKAPESKAPKRARAK